MDKAGRGERLAGKSRQFIVYTWMNSDGYEDKVKNQGRESEL
jgi:hypothetical protein